MAPNDLRAQFFELLHSGYEADAEVTGVCQFQLASAGADLDFHVIVGRTLTFGEGRHERPSATVRLPLKMLERLLSGGEQLDFRNPEIMSQIEVTGDARLAALLGNLLKRPPNVIADRLVRAEKRARSSPPVTEIERVRAPNDEAIRRALADEDAPSVPSPAMRVRLAAA